jgi:hypothetical protein
MLRSREHAQAPTIQGGLGIDVSKYPGSGQVGHKSTLNHAQEQASHEVLQE